MSSAKLRAFAEWFIEIVPSRIAMLEHVVGDGFVPDMSPRSLVRLGAWYRAGVDLMPLAAAPPEGGIAAASHGLSPRTLSMAFDFGIYAGEVMIHGVEGARWEQHLVRRSDKNYGHVVVVARRTPIDPVSIAIAQAYGIGAGRVPDWARFLEAWRKVLLTP